MKSEERNLSQVLSQRLMQIKGSGEEVLHSLVKAHAEVTDCGLEIGRDQSRCLDFVATNSFRIWYLDLLGVSLSRSDRREFDSSIFVWRKSRM